MSIRTESSTPWYREPWPWLLMMMPAVAVVAGFFTLWIAIKTNDGLVADDYYKQGLAINKTLAQDERALGMGLSARCRFTEEVVTIALSAHPSETLPERLELTLSHPTRAGLDQVVDLAGGSGKYQGAMKRLPAGRWLIVLEDAARNWRLTGTVHIPDDKETTLGGADLSPVD